MLYQRILTAIPLAAFAFWIIFFQETPVFFYFILFITLISGYEWAKLSGVNNILLRFIFAFIIAIATWLIQQFAADLVHWIIYVAVMWWVSITYYLKIAIPKSASSNLKLDKLVVSILVLPAAALAMSHIHENMGAEWLFYALSLVWLADIGAYFSGKKFGKTKLSPNISPGKTKEGLLGGIFVTVLYAILVSFYFDLNEGETMLLVLLTVVVTFVSVTGDLYLSFLKREAGLKDSGNILPGHGGVLDRLDSALAAMPVFIVGFNWWLPNLL